MSKGILVSAASERVHSLGPGGVYSLLVPRSLLQRRPGRRGASCWRVPRGRVTRKLQRKGGLQHKTWSHFRALFEDVLQCFCTIRLPRLP